MLHNRVENSSKNAFHWPLLTVEKNNPFHAGIFFMEKHRDSLLFDIFSKTAEEWNMPDFS
jgi:hypothetical protein